MGAIFATFLIWSISSTLKTDLDQYGANLPGDLSLSGAFLVEVILTFVFVFIVLSVTTTKFIAPNLAVLVIGFTLTMVHLIGIPLTGTSVNPSTKYWTCIIHRWRSIINIMDIYISSPF
ncbi:aquaporin [Staphylococcus saprophyticus]|uniref:aquaporin n=1 Tax=Staphylococcus saprophyticus TaxID=29385 RepID=UPI003F91F5D1